MSKLLDDLRQEQRHYGRSLHGEGRAENIKRIADHIEDLEAKLARAVELVEEANDIFGGILEGSYIVDSFTSQPYRLFLKTLAELSEKGEGE